jgi:lysophospholipase L1-like esterase
MQTLIAPVKTIKPRVTSEPLKVIALGDSIVYGFGDTEGGGWVERLRRRWMSPESPGHVLYNLGVRGDRVQQVSERLDHEFRYRGELKNKLPDLIILSVGVNDSGRLGRLTGRNYTDFDVYKQNLANLLDQAQSLCPVLFVGMIPIDESKMPFLDCFYFNHADQYVYKQAAKMACVEKNIPYLDIFDLWINRGENWCKAQLSADGLHPNVNGYKSLFSDVINWQAIAQLSPNHSLNFRG